VIINIHDDVAVLTTEPLSTSDCVVEYVAFTIALCPGARLLLDIVIELVIWSSIIQILDRYTVPVFWHHVG